MKILKYALFFTFAAFVFAGCDKGFEELNKNPNEPTQVPAGLLLADIIRNSGNNLYSTFNGGDMGECWGQHWAKVQYNDEARYSPRSSVLESTWKNYYEDVVSDGGQMEILAIAEGNEVAQGAAIVMQAYGFLLLTDYYGDVPFSEAAKASEGNFTPKYDKQEDVYDGVISMLQRAAELLKPTADNPDASGLVANSDLIYGADASKWEKFANSLQFRALMRISGKKDVGGDLTALLDKPMFESNADDAELVFLGAVPNGNPVWETIVEGVREEFKANSVLVDMLKDNSDPRLAVYVAQNAAGEYRGKPSGYFNVPNDEYDYSNVSGIGDFYLRAQAPAVFMSYSELLFLKAEAKARNLISAGTAKGYYESAIEANLIKNEIGDAFATYIATPFAAFNDTDALEKIGNQKWLALFGQGTETWTEWRRTGIPALTPAIEGEIDEIPSRYKYPSIEQSVNGASYDEAVANQGPDNLTTKMWWMD